MRPIRRGQRRRPLAPTRALPVRDGEDLRALHSSTAGYLRESHLELCDPSQDGPDLSRGFPGMRVWLTLKVFGSEHNRASLADTRELAVWEPGQFPESRGSPWTHRHNCDSSRFT